MSPDLVATKPRHARPLPSKQIELSKSPLAKAYPVFAFLPKDRHPGLIFVGIEQENGYRTCAGIVIVQNGSYRFVEFGGESEAWIQVYASADRRHFWAVTDCIIEDPGWDLGIAHSADGGATWVDAGRIHKPSYLAGFHALRIRADGTGELMLGLRDDGLNVATGYYVSTTKDWGDSWSDPVHAPGTLMLDEPDLSSIGPATQVPLATYLQITAMTSGTPRRTPAGSPERGFSPP